MRPLWAEINLDALSHNLAMLRERAGRDKKIIASIKANAYGHGAVRVARALCALGVDMLATGSFDEALAIRKAGVGTDILMFGACEPAGVAELVKRGFIVTVYDPALARAAAAAAPARVFIKIDCGFGRLGVPLSQARTFIHEVAALDAVRVEGLYTHAPFADVDGQRWATTAVEQLSKLLAALANDGISIPIVQALASAGVETGLDDPGNAICPGHALYGLHATDRPLAHAVHLKPVLRAVRARLIHVHSSVEARRFGSGGKRRLPAGATIGVLPLGLSDGFRAAASGGSLWMLYRGVRVPVLAVSLEHTCVDLTEVPAATIGDTVTIIGEDNGARITLDDIAASRGSTPLEVVMSLSGRLHLLDGALNR